MCTLEKNGNVFVLTITGSSNEDEHRLGPTLINSILSSLSQVKSQATAGSALVTTSRGKFFSNGFDLAWAHAAGSNTGALDRLRHMSDIFKPIIAELLSFPMPTIAAINGHAAATGFMLALSHDYLFMRRDKGVLYMSEVDIGLTIPDYFAAMFQSKVGSAQARRDILLKAAKIKGEQAVKMGIVESAAHDSEEQVVEASMRFGEQLAARKWNGQVYAEIRKSLYPDICGNLGLVAKEVVANSKL